MVGIELSREYLIFRQSQVNLPKIRAEMSLSDNFQLITYIQIWRFWVHGTAWITHQFSVCTDLWYQLFTLHDLLKLSLIDSNSLAALFEFVDSRGHKDINLTYDYLFQLRIFTILIYLSTYTTNEIIKTKESIELKFIIFFLFIASKKFIFWWFLSKVF